MAPTPEEIQAEAAEKARLEAERLEAERLEMARLEAQRKREEVAFHLDRSRVNFRSKRARLKNGAFHLDAAMDADVPGDIKLSALAAMKEITTLFDEKYKSLSHAGDTTAALTRHSLQTAMISLANDTSRSIKAAGGDVEKVKEITAEFHEVLAEQKAATIAAMEKVIREKGYIDHQALAMLDQRSDIIAQLLVRPDNQALLEIYKYAIDGSADKPEHLIGTIDRYLKEPKLDEATTQIIWFVIGELTQDDRIEIGKGLKERMDAEELESTLDRGNLRGVFSLDEMESIRGDKYEDESERERYNKQFIHAQDMKDDVKKLADSYGAYNQAGEMLTGANAVGFIFDAGMLLMGASNVAVGIWKDPMGIVKNEYVWASAIGLTGRHFMAKEETLEVALAPEEVRTMRARESARRNLTREIRNTTSWEQWDQFFQSDSYNGVDIFSHFRDYMRDTNDGEIPAEIKPETFELFLQVRAQESKNPEVKERYQKAHAAFEKVTHRDNIARLLQVFNDVKDAGINDEDGYKQAIITARNSRI